MSLKVASNEAASHEAAYLLEPSAMADAIKADSAGSTRVGPPSSANGLTSLTSGTSMGSS